MTNGLFFVPILANLTKGEVERVLSGAADEDRETTNAVLGEDRLVAVHEIDNLLVSRIFAHIVLRVEDPESIVEDVGRLAVVAVSLTELDKGQTIRISKASDTDSLKNTVVS